MLIACAIIKTNAQDRTNAIKHDNRSSTKIIQTYRFDELLDDGSYTIKIENLSSNINILGHEGSGAKVVIRNIAQVITEQEAQEAYEHSKTIVNFPLGRSLRSPPRGVLLNYYGNFEFPAR